MSADNYDLEIYLGSKMGGVLLGGGIREGLATIYMIEERSPDEEEEGPGVVTLPVSSYTEQSSSFTLMYSNNSNSAV